jgi:hypothetical protein
VAGNEKRGGRRMRFGPSSYNPGSGCVGNRERAAGASERRCLNRAAVSAVQDTVEFQDASSGPRPPPCRFEREEAWDVCSRSGGYDTNEMLLLRPSSAVPQAATRWSMCTLATICVCLNKLVLIL